MADFSIGKAIGSGFSLVARRPLAALAWSVAYVLVAIVPTALMFGYLFSEMPALFEGLRHMDPKTGPSAEMFRLQSRIMMANPLIFVTGLAGRALLVGAVYRSILAPDDRRFFSLRFGKQELWLALALFLYSLMVGFALIGVMIGGGILGGLAWLLGKLFASTAVATLVRVLLIGGVVIAALGTWIWLAVRLSLGPVMTFADRELRLHESWILTKGQGWKLASLSVVLGIMAMVIAMIMEGIFIAIIYARLGGFDRTHVQAFFPPGQTPNFLSLLGALAPALAFGAALVGPLFAILVAPFASAYKELKES